MFTELLSTHVQRLATIANGDCACTTHVPLIALGTVGASGSTADPPDDQDHQRHSLPSEDRTARGRSPPVTSKATS